MSHPQPSPPQTEFTENIEYEQELLNDEILNQLYYIQASAVSDSQPYASTSTYIGETNTNYATNTFNDPIQHSSQVLSQSSSSPHLFQQISWDFQDMSNQFATLATTSYATLNAEPNYPQYVAWEETVVPEGGVFPIDLPIPPDDVDVDALFADSELVQSTSSEAEQQQQQPLNDSPPQQAEPSEPMPTYIEPVDPTYSYDDNDIPRNDESWLVRPQKHPWVQSGRAYLCPYDECYFVVQRKNRHVHNAKMHGVPLY
ncbi:hypothetical protein Clacol_002200 [Clathrus columnatus]|uniref:C2H2-type domain-containing protein n=1 Tax=Clathrus columnatus TaxID=1419009 RepID=A0AAV5A5Q9_9AGAM|nr:hypothetical protein Clacol_002200 [Clathrus columnatus]